MIEICVFAGYVGQPNHSLPTQMLHDIQHQVHTW